MRLFLRALAALALGIALGFASSAAFAQCGGDLAAVQGGCLVVGIQKIPVSPATPANSQALVYNSTARQWQPTTIGAGSGNVSTSGTITTGTVGVWATATGLAGTQAFGTTGVSTIVKTGAGGLLDNSLISGLPNANLAAQTADTLLGALTATTPSGIAVPACTDTGGNHLNWTLGTGFSCGTTNSGGTAALSGMTATQVPIAATAATVTSSLPTTGTTAVAGIVSTTSAAKVNGDAAVWDTNGNLIDGGTQTPGYVSSNWYPIGAYIGGTGTAVAAIDTVYCMPMTILGVGATAKTLGVRSSATGTTAVVKLAIYSNSTTNFRPAALLGATGEVSISSAPADFSGALSPTVPLTQGIYWACSLWNWVAAPSVIPLLTSGGTVGQSALRLGGASINGVINSGFRPGTKYTTAGLYTTGFPSSLSGLTTDTNDAYPLMAWQEN